MTVDKVYGDCQAIYEGSSKRSSTPKAAPYVELAGHLRSLDSQRKTLKAEEKLFSDLPPKINTHGVRPAIIGPGQPTPAPAPNPQPA